MKKIKLLMPILTSTALVGTATTLVSCFESKPEVQEAKVKVNNLNEETKDVTLTCDKSKAEVGKDLTAKLTWDAADTGAYYISSIYVLVGVKTIHAYNELTQPNGFNLSNQTKTSTDIFVPKVNIVDSSEINIVIDLKLSNFDEPVQIVDFSEDYIALTNWRREVIATYDVLRSIGNIETESETPESFLQVDAGKTYQFAFDLTKWGNNFDPNAPIYAIMGYWNATSKQFQPFQPTLDNCGYIWYGASDADQKPITCTEGQGITAFELSVPEGGWGSLAANRKNLYFSYKFSSDHHSFFQIMVGQEHLE